MPSAAWVDNNARIAKLLTDLGVSFEKEYAFEGLTGLHGGPLRFDFFLPATALRPELLIEYQGVQHYSTCFGVFPGPGNVYPDAIRYRDYQQQLHDQRKACFALINRIPLLLIPPGLSEQVERALLVESLAFWTEQHERHVMSAEDTWSLRNPGFLAELQARLTSSEFITAERKMYDHLTESIGNVFTPKPKAQWGRLGKRHARLVRAVKRERQQRRAPPTIVLRDPLSLSFDECNE